MSQEDEPPDRVGPWGPPPSDDGTVEPAPPAREPMFNAPWPAVAIVGVIVVAYGLQSRLAPGDAGILRWGFAPADLDHGRWLGLVTVMFVHGGWAHALINAVAALAFGPPVARLMGPGIKGPALFFLFYLACGVIATFGYTIFGSPLMGGASVAWQAHLAGFVAGVLLIEPFARLAGWKPVAGL